MANTKLPKDFRALLDGDSLARVKAVFDTCDIDARGGYGDQTAIALPTPG